MKRYFKKTAMMICSAVLLLAASGQARAGDLLSTVTSTQVITIGTSNDAPLSYLDPKDQSATGALTDILAAALKRMGVKASIHMVAMPFSSLIPALTSGRIDLIGDAMYATPARQKIIDFTDITFYNPESLDVATGNPEKIHSLVDLCGHSAGSYEGTAFIDELKTASAACPSGQHIDIHQYPTIGDVFSDLSAGRIDAAVVDSSLSAYALKQNPALNFELVGDYKPEGRQGTGCAFGVAKGSADFVAAFNKAYTAMLADGSAAAIFAKWGLTPTAFFLSR